MAIPILGNLTVAGDLTLDEHKVLYIGDGDLSLFCSTNAYIRSTVSNADLIFDVNDGGSNITALTLDGADDGKATFKSDILIPDGYIGRDDHNGLHFTTDNVINYRLGDSHIFRMETTNFRPYVDSSYDLGTSSYYFRNAYIDTIDTTAIYNTSLLVGRAAGTEYISFAVDNKVVIHVDSTEYRFLGSALVPGTDNARDLGSTVKQWKDLHLGGDLIVDGSIARGTPTTASNSGNTHTMTLADNDNFNVTVANAATTIALTVASSDIGKSGMIVITNPASVGSLSFVALPSYMLTPSGATLNFVTTANAVSIISYYVHATDKVLVNYVGNFA